MIPDFKEAVRKMNPCSACFDKLVTLQVNVGDKCNQCCEHCHLTAGPEGHNMMPQDVMEKIINFLSHYRGLVLDITGGCPELNPHLKSFVERVHGFASRVMVRTNLTILTEEGMDWIPSWYKEQGVVLIASLPCYTEKNVNRQRGNGVFEKSIEALKKLNELGYGSALELNLIYNPSTDSLPAPQQQLEEDYRHHLFTQYGIGFSNLFTIVNVPLGRFKNYLESCGRTEDYFKLLVNNFNPETVENIMCRTLINVDWRGIVYNCDFNQASGLPMRNRNGAIITIDSIGEVLERGPEIVMGEHCYSCTAGSGSSCTGVLV
jgi:radical SAM/Cys-rich protein